MHQVGKKMEFLEVLFGWLGKRDDVSKMVTSLSSRSGSHISSENSCNIAN